MVNNEIMGEFRFSLVDEYPQLTEEDLEIKKVKKSSPIYKEFQDLAALVNSVITDRETKRSYVLGFRDGINITVKRTYNLVFDNLLRMMNHPEASWWTLEELEDVVEDINHGLTSLFGQENIMAARTANWLELAKTTNTDKFTRQQAVASLRDLLPRLSEVPADTYKQLRLDDLDRALERGLRPWDNNEEQARTMPEFGEEKMEDSDEEAGLGGFGFFTAKKRKRASMV